MVCVCVCVFQGWVQKNGCSNEWFWRVGVQDWVCDYWFLLVGLKV